MDNGRWKGIVNKVVEYKAALSLLELTQSPAKPLRASRTKSSSSVEITVGCGKVG